MIAQPYLAIPAIRASPCKVLGQHSQHFRPDSGLVQLQFLPMTPPVSEIMQNVYEPVDGNQCTKSCVEPADEFLGKRLTAMDYHGVLFVMPIWDHRRGFGRQPVLIGCAMGAHGEVMSQHPTFSSSPAPSRSPNYPPDRASFHVVLSPINCPWRKRNWPFGRINTQFRFQPFKKRIHALRRNLNGKPLGFFRIPVFRFGDDF